MAPAALFTPLHCRPGQTDGALKLAPFPFRCLVPGIPPGDRWVSIRVVHSGTVTLSAEQAESLRFFSGSMRKMFPGMATGLGAHPVPIAPAGPPPTQAQQPKRPAFLTPRQPPAEGAGAGAGERGNGTSTGSWGIHWELLGKAAQWMDEDGGPVQDGTVRTESSGCFTRGPPGCHSTTTTWLLPSIYESFSFCAAPTSASESLTVNRIKSPPPTLLTLARRSRLHGQQVRVSSRWASAKSSQLITLVRRSRSREQQHARPSCSPFHVSLWLLFSPWSPPLSAALILLAALSQLRSHDPLAGKVLRWWCTQKRPDLSPDSTLSASKGTFRQYFRDRWGRDIEARRPQLPAP